MSTTDPFLHAVTRFPRYLLTVEPAGEEATGPHEAGERPGVALVQRDDNGATATSR